MNALKKAPAVPAEQALEDLDNRITGDEDARVRTDIPEGGGNALAVALEQLQLAVHDAPFRLIGDRLGTAATVLALGSLSLIAAAYIRGLPEVSEPS